MDDYYQKYYRNYHKKTFSIDPSSFLEPLIPYLFEGCSILDIGCGSGRDMLWLKNRGFEVCGFERSSGLAELARKNVGSNVIEGDFEVYDFSQMKTDAIILVGALVHIQHDRLPMIIKSVTAGLKQSGHVLITLKQGNGGYADKNNRIFYYWQNKDLHAIYTSLGFSVLSFNKQASKVDTNDTWLGYVLKKGHG